MRILFLDDDLNRAEQFLTRHPQAQWVQTSEACIACLSEDWHEVHLDHDLGGETFVNSGREDCGMAVVRWLCREPRASLTEHAQFFVHSHNFAAAAEMVQSLRAAGYRAVYRPFGIDVLDWLSTGDVAGDAAGAAAESPVRPKWRAWLDRLRGWRSRGREHAGTKRARSGEVQSASWARDFTGPGPGPGLEPESDEPA